MIVLAGILPCHAQTNAPADDAPSLNVIGTFSGSKATTTDPFQVPDKWEVRWTSAVPLRITIFSADHKVVAGTVGVQSGSFFLTAGGGYYLQMEPQPPPPPPPPPPPATTTDGDQAPPTTAFGTTTLVDTKWSVQVVALPPGADLSPSDATNAVTTPAPPPAPAEKMTDDQARAVVLVSGDNAQGTGFLIKTPSGPAVVTNIHLIANNPNLKVTTNSGAIINVISTSAASDRDLALLAIQDDHYSYLDVSTDISHTVEVGDTVITPGNSQGGEVMLNTTGKILAIGPEQIEFDNPIYHGNSGGPVFHLKSGKVLGVVTEANKPVNSDDLQRTPFANRNSSGLHFFGLRLDTVSEWMPLDATRLQVENTFLDQFHETNRRLDAYLNPQVDGDGYVIDRGVSTIYRADEDIMKANDRYLQQSVGGDAAQRQEALRGLIFDLNGVIDSNMTQIQNLDNFYPFNHQRAKDELDYRNALKTELDAISTDADRMGRLPRADK